MPVFYQTPEEYRAETARVPRFWWVFCPIAIPIGLWLLTLVNTPFYREYLQGEESGILEFLHAALPLAAAAIAARLLFMRPLRNDAFVALWLALFVVGGIYLGGEEASWGQHYFGWSTPETWSEINIQDETNLHNTSFWFDKLPRVAITVLIMVGGMVVPFLKLRGSRLIPRRFDFMVPPLALSVLTGVFIFGEIVSGLRASSDLLDGWTEFRGGEMQENFIVAFLFFYAIFLWSRAKRLASGHAQADSIRGWAGAGDRT